MELDDDDILPDLVVKQEAVDPPAKRAKKMKEEVSLNETTVATGDVNVAERVLLNRTVPVQTRTLTSAVKMDLRMRRILTNLRKRMRSLAS